MKKVSVLIKPASSLCNLRCKYCFYANVCSLREVRSFGNMSKDTVEDMIRNLFEDLVDGDELTLAFQGGEPTLAGIKYYKNLINVVQQQSKCVKVNYSLQTNGTLITNEWCELFKEHKFLIGLSIDGCKEFHDLNRVDTRGEGTFDKILEAKQLFDEYEINYNILCVVTNALAKEYKKVYCFLRDHNIKYVQFIPCIGKLDSNSRTKYQLTPSRFYLFYSKMFKFWFEDLLQGRYTSIKLFDDLFNLFVNKEVNACGLVGNCQIQFVIEGDGSVYPCDFYVLDEWKLGNIREQGLKELLLSKRSREFLCRPKEWSDECGRCPFVSICRGGCRRMTDVMFIDKKTNNCAYRKLLKLFMSHVDEILHTLGKIY